MRRQLRHYKLQSQKDDELDDLHNTDNLGFDGERQREREESSKCFGFLEAHVCKFQDLTTCVLPLQKLPDVKVENTKNSLFK